MNQDKSLEQHILDNIKNQLLLVFIASWSSHNRIIDIVLQKVSNVNHDIKIIKIDVERYPDLLSKYYIQKVPSALVINQGEIIGKLQGVFSKKDVLDKFG